MKRIYLYFKEKIEKEDYGLELSTEDYYITIRPCINLPK